MVDIKKEIDANKFNDEKHQEFVEKRQKEYEDKKAKIKQLAEKKAE